MTDGVDIFLRNASVDELDIWIDQGGELPARVRLRYLREREIRQAVRAGVHERTIERAQVDKERRQAHKEKVA
ncbi:hypothetical protein [Humisphaera borealis]|uniref:Uncharacterized protein n=1 Tax=Humisphaera borealis TaxID=2807512 RepID=A0A7M2X1B1_9BACT|nr:hypothetical protein [Humisphaera borealis]QOV90911.1 hypothetical protein IPV69_06000 [Humisphaera borealis]